MTWQPRAWARRVSSPSVLQLGELGRVRGVGDAAGAQAVAQAERDVVLPHDVAQVVEMRVERVLLVVGDHPLGHQRAAPRDDPGDPVRRQRDVVAEDARVEGHVIDALLGLVLDHVEQVPGREILDLLDALDRLVHRHGADRERAGGDDRLPDRVDIAAGRKVHHRVGTQVDGHLQLGELVVDVGGHRRVADVGVDLAPGLDADAHRLQARAEMHGIRRDDHPPARNFGSDQFGIEVLAPGHVLHLGRNHTPPRQFNLRHHQASSQNRPTSPAQALGLVGMRVGFKATS